MTPIDNVASFVLRFTQEMWQDTEGEPHIQWRGHIRHVQGDEEVRFTNFTDAVMFIQRYLTKLALDGSSRGEPLNQGKVLRESFKLWKQFTSSYTDMMFQMLEQNIDHTETFREYMDEAVENVLKAWQLPMHQDQKQLIETLDHMQQQLQALSDKVDRLEQTIQQLQQETKSGDVV